LPVMAAMKTFLYCFPAVCSGFFQEEVTRWDGPQELFDMSKEMIRSSGHCRWFFMMKGFICSDA
jgi:hypothetical protein